MDYTYTIDYARHTSQTISAENSNAHSDYSNGYSMGFADGYAQKDKEIIRCKNCKHYMSMNSCCYRRLSVYSDGRILTDDHLASAPIVMPDDFCSRAERKERDE